MKLEKRNKFCAQLELKQKQKQPPLCTMDHVALVSEDSVPTDTCACERHHLARGRETWPHQPRSWGHAIRRNGDIPHHGRPDGTDSVPAKLHAGNSRALARTPCQPWVITEHPTARAYRVSTKFLKCQPACSWARKHVLTLSLGTLPVKPESRAGGRPLALPSSALSRGTS